MARILVLDTLKHPSNSGTANITLSSDETTTMPAVNINGGQIDSTTVGASTPSSVAATTLTASGNATVGGTFGVTGATTAATFNATGTATLATVDINGGAIDGTIIGANSAAAGTFTTIDTGQGANELYDMDQNVKTDSAVTFTTVNTGQGANELYSMNQSVSSTGAAPSFYTEAGGLGLRDYYNTTNLLYRRGSCLWTNTDSSSALSFTVGEASNLINIGIGKDVLAGLNSSSAYGNVAIGDLACGPLTSGAGNTAVGRRAGSNITSGSQNICLGYYSGRSTSPSGTISTGSNVICLGDNSIGNIYCADTSISSSDGRDKTDVEDFTAGLDWIEAMRPITYHWDKRSWYTEVDEETGEITSQSEPDGTHKKDKKNIGFIAQEVLEIEKAHGFAGNKDDMLTVNLNEDDTAYGMKYERLVPVLVNAIKELSQSNKELSTRITTLETA